MATIPESNLNEEPAALIETPEVAGAWRNPNTHAYISRIKGRSEENLFLEEYYSSTDTKIYFDDIEQTEIGYIQYSVQEQLKPIYGYSSRTWDDVAIGNRIVTGILKVPIRNIDVREYGENLKNPSLNDVITYYRLKNTFGAEAHNEAQLEKVTNLGIITPGGGAPNSTLQNTYFESTVLFTKDHNYTQGEIEPDKALNVNHVGNSNNNEWGRIGYPSSSNLDTSSHITDSSIYDSYISEGSDEFIYRQKLQSLGYDLENGSSALSFEKQIAKFQNDMKSMGYNIRAGSYGKLTSATKQAIDDACNRKWSEQDEIIIPANSKLYNMPSEKGFVIYTIPEDLTFIILQDSINDSNNHIWKKVSSKDMFLNYTGFYCKDICHPDKEG